MEHSLQRDSEHDLQADRDQANRWLARFAPLVRGMDTLSAKYCRSRLEALELLRPGVALGLASLRASHETEDGELLTTLESAEVQLDMIETSLKRRLASLSPGDPEGMVDLASLRKDLAEVAARHEVEEAVGVEPRPQRLELRISNGNLAAAGFMGLFSVGWLSFTTVHAIFMIGGMMRAFGPLALLLLGFYALFFAVGIGMGAAAVASACREEIELDGRSLSIRRSLLGFSWVKEYTLAANASIRQEQSTQMRQQGAATKNKVLVVETAPGSQVKFGAGCSPERQREHLKRINEYLKGIG